MRNDAARPAITAPVSRFLAVADVARSVAFYRDILGFTEEAVRAPARFATDAEVVYGPARLQLARADTAPDSTGGARARGSAILYFETDDVAAMREAVIARGGAPSEIEKANWIKMRLFEVRDPDGHVLWFAQTFHEPDRPREPGQLRQALPALPLKDIAGGIAHYRDVLGFHVNYAQDDLGVMNRDDITVLLVPKTGRHAFGQCEFYIRDADALHAELVAKGARVQGAPVSHPWGLRDFTVLDCEGNELVFAETFE